MPDAAPVAPAAAPAAQPNGAAPAAKAETAAEALYELTVDGKPQKYTRREVEKFAGKGAFADKLVAQAKEALRAAADRRAKDEADEADWKNEEKWEELLSKRGVDLDKLARRRVEAKVKQAELTPEQQEAAQAKREAAEAKAKLQEREKADADAREAEATTRLQRHMESQLADAAERAGFPKDADSFFAIMEAVKEFARLRMPWDPDRIVETARENIDGGFKRLEQSVLKGLKGKALADRLGPEIVKELLRWKTEEFRTGGSRPTPVTQRPTEPAKQEHLSVTDLANKYRGGIR